MELNNTELGVIYDALNEWVMTVDDPQEESKALDLLERIREEMV